MAERGNALHGEHQRIARAQPHRSLQPLDRLVHGLAEQRRELPEQCVAVDADMDARCPRRSA
jgi:hypothetical protein